MTKKKEVVQTKLVIVLERFSDEHQSPAKDTHLKLKATQWKLDCLNLNFSLLQVSTSSYS
jgi:hypothetical protein